MPGAFTWDARAHTFRDGDGKPVPPSAIRQAIDAIGETASAKAREAGDAFAAGSINDAEFRLKVRAQVKAALTAATAAGAGGWKQTTTADFAEAGRRASAIYKELDGLIRKFHQGEATGPQLAAWAAALPKLARGAYEAIRGNRATAAGFDEARRVLAAGAKHCEECEAEADQWVPVDELLPIGECQCQGNCLCSVEYRRSGAAEPTPAPEPPAPKVEPAPAETPVPAPVAAKPEPIPPPKPVAPKPAPKPKAPPPKPKAPPPKPTPPPRPKPVPKPREFADVEAMDRWGDAKFKGWAKSLTPAESEAVLLYGTDTYGVLNGLLRGMTWDQVKADPMTFVPPGMTEGQARKLLADTQSAFRKGTVPEPIRVFRGIKEGSKLGLGDLTKLRPGTEFVESGFASTSLDKQMAVEFAGPSKFFPSNAVLRITVPEGTRGAYLDAGGLATFKEAKELTLAPGARYRVTGHGEMPGQFGPVPVLDLEVVP